MKKTSLMSLKQGTTIVLIITTILALFALALGIENTTSMHRYDKASMEQYTNDTGRVYRLYFCHDRNIVPCDDISIKEWNDAHPDDTFNSMPIH